MKIIVVLIMIYPSLLEGAHKWRWKNTGHLYDELNQYTVICRLTKEKRVDPFFGEDSVKCHYRCQDYKDIKDEFVITTHSNHICERQVTQTRGDKRDWRSK